MPIHQIRFWRGFTLIELFIVIAIISIILSIVGLSYSRLNSSRALDESASLVISILDEARSLTLSSIGGSQYSVRLGNSETVLFKGSVYSSGDPSNVATNLNSKVGIRNIVLNGGGVDVVFERLTGRTNMYGSLEVYLLDATTSARIINIGANGVSDANF